MIFCLTGVGGMESRLDRLNAAFFSCIVKIIQQYSTLLSRGVICTSRLYVPSTCNPFLPHNVHIYLTIPFVCFSLITREMFTSLTDLTDQQKEEFVASLCALLVGSVDNNEVTAEKLEAVASASGNTLNGALASLVASVVTKSGGIEKFCAAPGGGGGGGGGGVGGGGGGSEQAAAAPAAKEEEEEEEMDLGGGMDMFGGEEGGGGDY